MKLKTVEIDGKTYAETIDGKPVYVRDGQDAPFDAAHTLNKISELNAEAKGHREAKEAAEAKLKGFEGIQDVEAALKALETVAALDDKTLIDAGQVEKVKEEARRAQEEATRAALAKKDAEYAPIVKERDKLKGANSELILSQAFSGSDFVQKQVAIPTDFLRAYFKENFGVEDGQLVPKDNKGNTIYSNERPGDVATFEEAIKMLVSQHPNKDSILAGNRAGGGGAGQNRNGNGGGDNTMTRADFDKLPEGEKHARMAKGLQIVS